MTPSLDGRRFGGPQTTSLREDREGIVTGTYAGGPVVAGTLAGRRDGRDLSYAFAHLTSAGQSVTGTCEARVEALPDGSVRLHETYAMQPGGSGTAVLEELPGPRWVRVRVAHPSRSLEDAVAFYGGLLSLPVDGPYDSAPYRLVFIGLPGGGQLELTEGGPAPVPATVDDLLVLYVPTAADVAAVRDALVDAGVALERAHNPYWQQMGVTVRDPDGRLVVVAQLPG